MENGANLIWIDLEMTGLNAQKDKILEIATLVTDKDLNIVSEGPCLAIKHKELPEMDEWVTNAHTQSGLFERLNSSEAVSLKEAEEQTLKFIMSFAKEGVSHLCGNSIWQDKQFLQNYMPSITNYLHYRVVDVSTIKVLVNEWYPNNPNVAFEKKKVHRALDDIKESIDELRYYRKHFFISG